MLKFEIKKIFSKAMNKIVLCVLVALVLLGSFLTLKDIRYVKADGTVVTGFSAARELRKVQNEWKGELNEEILQKVLRENHSIIEEEGGLESEKAYARTQGFLDIKEMINDALVGFEEYDYYKVDNLDGMEKTGIYEKRIADLKDWLEKGEGKDMFSKAEKQFLIQKWEELKTPFYYEYAAGWIALLEESQILPTLLCIITVIAGFLVAGVFSDEFSNKSDAVFFSSRYGRNKAVAAKVGAGIVITTLIYWGAVLAYSLIVLGFTGFGGANIPIQLVDWKSMYNLTFIQKYFLVVGCGYVGCLFILGIAMFVSVMTRSSLFAIAAAFGISCIPMFLGRISFLSKAINFFPDMLLRISPEMDEFLIYNVGGKMMGLFDFLPLIYIVLYILLLPVLYYVYKRTEVK